ncbi:MAG: flagellar basal body-associated protein FliL [Rhodobacteraceae bacterium]|nr:flagellar basal body-associated protein FliL [Paracoccaceae bacterium]
MKKLLPIILLLLGGGGGVGAGYFLRPAPHEPEMMAECAEGDELCTPAEAGGHGEEMAAEEGDHGEADSVAEDGGHEAGTTEGTGNEPEYVALQRQMIVPIVSDDKVISLVVLSLSIEVEAGYTLDVYDREPKIRDAFLQVLFRHANTGGFNGDFTSGEKMADLRRALNSAAAQVLGPIAIQVLVTDILRQAT